VKIPPELKEQIFPDNLILSGYRGSIAHNMYIPNTDPNSIDDIDLMGVYMANPRYYVGLGHKTYAKVIEKFIDKYDVVHYEFKHFVNLLCKSNPNVLSLLWLEDNKYLKNTVYGQMLIENRNLFVSKYAYYSFSGYADGQLKRMTHFSTEGYMGKKRRALVEKYGYDCKNAAHCIRLLKMGIEYLMTGELKVARPDAKWLLEIKKGQWKLEDVKEEATRLFKLADEALVKSNIPSKPDFDKIEQLVIEITLDWVHKSLKR
jgi:predicted nucleotidyltransferase